MEISDEKIEFVAKALWAVWGGGDDERWQDFELLVIDAIKACMEFDAKEAAA